MLINQNVKTLFKINPTLLLKVAAWIILFTSLTLLSSINCLAAETISADLKLPPVEVIEKAKELGNNQELKPNDKEGKESLDPQIDKIQEKNLQALDPPKAKKDICQTTLVSQDLEKKYLEIQKRLESDFKKGMPKQLRTDLVRVRADIDELIGQLFDLDTENSQEINQIVQRTIDYLEKMIGLLPKANKIAPMVRDRYVIPFTNISSIKAEHQECLMKSAIAEVKEKSLASDNEEPSINIYRKLTEELKSLNQNLYTLQTTDVQKFIGFRAELLHKLEKFNKNKENGTQVTANIPKILNSVHNEIEKLLPGLQLSENFYSSFR